MPTSPLLQSIYPPKSTELKAINASPRAPEPTIFIDDAGNLTNQHINIRRASAREGGQDEKKELPSRDILFSKALNVLMESATRGSTRGRDQLEKTPQRGRTTLATDIPSDEESEPADEIPSPTPLTRTSTNRQRYPSLAMSREKAKDIPESRAVSDVKGVKMHHPDSKDEATIEKPKGRVLRSTRVSKAVLSSLKYLFYETFN